MIFDNVRNMAKYEKVLPGAAACAEWLKGFSLETAPGRYDIAEGVYVNVKRGMTKPHDDTKYESHRQFADIQLVADGTEMMGWASIDPENDNEGYSAENDVAFHDIDGVNITVDAGNFVVFFPWDAHRPDMCAGEPSIDTKLVFKIKL